MRYKLLGKSGLRVSELCLGTMTFGEDWGWGASKNESKKIYDLFMKAGGNFIDTANLYTNGTSEKYVGEFIGADREKIVLATKYTLSMRPGDPNASGNHRKNMVQALEASLKRLKTDYIDLYWVHIWDFLSPVEEVMRALDDLVRTGKVLYVGISDTPAWIVSRANTLAEQRGWTPFTALQVEYSLIERTIERELLPMAKALEIALTPWGCLGAGLLTGKYSKKTAGPKRLKQDEALNRLTGRNRKVAGEVQKIAGQIGKPASQVSLNWVRQQQNRAVVIPILGARTAAQIKDNLACLDFTLNEKHLKRLDDVSRIEMGFPHDFLAKERIEEIVYGGTLSQIDNHRK